MSSENNTNEVPNLTNEVNKDLNEVDDGQNKVPDSQNEVVGTTNEVPKITNEVTNNQNKVDDDLSKVNNTTNEVNKDLNKVTNTTNEVPKITNEVNNNPNEVANTTNEVPKITNEVNKDLSKVDDDLNEANGGANINPNTATEHNSDRKTPYTHFRVVRSNRDIVRCPENGLPMIDLRDKTTNKTDPQFHGLITDIRGHYEPLVAHVMGKGSFGEVFKGVNLQVSRLVAIKKLKIFETDEIFPITAQREIMILKKMEHLNVVTLSDVIFDNFDRNDGKRSGNDSSNISSNNSHNHNNSNKERMNPFLTEAEKAASGEIRSKKLPDRFFYMVLPYMVSDLAGVIHNPHFTIDIPKIKNMMQQILRGLDYVHKMKYFHRDIKTANILIDQYGVLKIADFGLSRIYYGCPPNLKYPGGSGAGIKFTPLVVTRWYRAPELVMFDRFYTTAIDIWGVGCILGEFFIKRPILQGKTDIEQGHLIFQLMGKPDFKSWPTLQYLKQYDAHYSNKNYKGEYKDVFGQYLCEDGLDLFARMLCLNPYDRITAAAALKHPWFDKSPLPAGSLVFERVMESHESDIDKFDKLKKEMDAQKNSLKNMINHIHNDVTPEPQLQLPQNLTGSSKSLVHAEKPTPKHPIGSRFDNTTPSKNGGNKTSGQGNKRDDQKKAFTGPKEKQKDSQKDSQKGSQKDSQKGSQKDVRRKQGSYAKEGGSRFDKNKEPGSRFDKSKEPGSRFEKDGASGSRFDKDSAVSAKVYHDKEGGSRFDKDSSRFDKDSAGSAKSHKDKEGGSRFDKDGARFDKDSASGSRFDKDSSRVDKDGSRGTRNYSYSQNWHSNEPRFEGRAQRDKHRFETDWKGHVHASGEASYKKNARQQNFASESTERSHGSAKNSHVRKQTDEFAAATRDDSSQNNKKRKLAAENRQSDEPKPAQHSLAKTPKERQTRSIKGHVDDMYD